MQEPQPIDIDPPTQHSLPHQHPHKRRRIKSPNPIARSATIDPSLARVLWDEKLIFPPHSTRRRRSNHSLSNSLPSPKKKRTSAPRSPRGLKRPTSPHSTDILSNDQAHNKRRKKNPVPLISTRSKICLSYFSKLPPTRLKNINISSSASSSNFILCAEARTQYARDVAEAEKIREEGNKFYHQKQYQLAIKLYTRALKLYPRQPLPNQPYHPGHSTSLANLGSAYMALSEYQLGAEKLEESIESVELTPLLPQDIRKTLIKRLFRLARCHLALLDSKAASSTLNFLQDPQSPVNITPNDSSFIQEFSTLIQRSQFLLQADHQLRRARSDFQWEAVLEIVQNVQVEVLNWGFNLKPDFLLGLWPLRKAEALARLGKPLEAEKIMSSCLQHPRPSVSELKMVEALISLAHGDLDEADAKLTGILNRDLDGSNIQRLSVHVKEWIRQMSNIERSCARFKHLQAVDQCEAFLCALTDPIALTLRIKVYTIICEQLSAYSIRNPDFHFHLPHKIIESSNTILTKYIKFSSASPIRESVTTYPIYRPYVIRILLARARATLDVIPAVSKSTYALVLELLNQIWPDLRIHNRSGILAEILAAIGGSSRNHRSKFSHSESHSNSNHHSLPSSFASWDPKGYYQVLEVRKDASASDIKKSFRRLSLKHHPDKGGKTEFFQTINVAYEILSNQDSRTSYDILGH